MSKIERNVIWPADPEFYKRFVDEFHHQKNQKYPSQDLRKVEQISPEYKIHDRSKPNKILGHKNIRRKQRHHDVGVQK